MQTSGDMCCCNTRNQFCTSPSDCVPPSPPSPPSPPPAPAAPLTIGKFDITIHRAANLPDTDFYWGDSTDPYAVLTWYLEGVVTKCGQTSTKWDTFSPEWNEALTCGCIPENALINIDIKDDDKTHFNENDDEVDHFNGKPQTFVNSRSTSGSKSSLSYTAVFNPSPCTRSSPPPSPSPSPPPAAPQSSATPLTLSAPSTPSCSYKACGCTCTTRSSFDQCFTSSEISNAIYGAGGCAAILDQVGGTCTDLPTAIQQIWPFPATCDDSSSLPIIIMSAGGGTVVFLLGLLLLYVRHRKKSSNVSSGPSGGVVVHPTPTSSTLSAKAPDPSLRV